MATYVNDLRLTELATGEGSGTWGTTTNVSLELIGEALGYATQQVFGSDADATTTIADGASDPARAMYFKITSAGSLTATRTCTIAPNTVSRVMFIENATTGSQSISISQGSGANVTILTGKTAVVYLDGAGSGAAVIDAMAGVDPGVTDTLAEVLTAGNTTTTDQKIQFRDSAIYINSSADGQLDIVADTEIQIAATTVDLNGNLDVSGTVVAGGVVTANAGVVVDNFTLDGTTLALSSGNMTLDSAGGLILDAATGVISLHEAGNGVFGTFTRASGSLAIKSEVSNADIFFKGVDDGSTITALTLDMSDGGTASFNSTIAATGGTFAATSGRGLVISNATTTHTNSVGVLNAQHSNGSFSFRTANVERLALLTGGNITITTADAFFYSNGSSGGTTIDAGLKFESSNQRLEFWTADAERMSIASTGAATFSSTIAATGATISGTTNDGSTLTQITQSGTGRGLAVNRNVASATRAMVNLAQLSASGGTEAVLDIQQTTPTSRAIKVNTDGSSDSFSVYGSGALVTAPAAGGHAVFNEDGRDVDFRVESDNLTSALFVNGADGVVTTGAAFTATGVVTANAGVVVDNFTLDGTTLALSSGDMTLDVAGDIILDTDGGDVYFKDGGTTNFQIKIAPSSAGVEFYNTVANEDLRIILNDGGSNVTALTLDAGAAGASTFSSSVTAGGQFKCTGSSASSVAFSVGDAGTGWYNTGSNSIGLATAGQQRLIFNSVGAATFSSTVTTTGINFAGDRAINNTGDTAYNIRTSSGSGSHYFGSGRTGFSGGVDIAQLGTGGSIFNEAGADLDFRVESDINTHAIFVEGSSSNVHINATTVPDASNSGFLFTTDQFYTSAGNTTNTNTQVRFYNGNGLVGNISTSGSGTAYATSSDQRLKENIADADDSGELIDAIQVRKFDWKADGEHQRYGMVAQELDPVAPEAVSKTDDPEEMMAVDYSKLVPMLIKEIQSLRNRVAQLES